MTGRRPERMSGMSESLQDLTIAERYRRVAAEFGETVAGVSDWDAPTPVAEWQARDVVGHLSTWLPGMLGGGAAITFDPVPDAADDPIVAWQGINTQVQGILDDPARAQLQHSNPHTDENHVEQVIDQYFTVDVFLHRWDLARASGQDDRLDPARVHEMFTGMTSMSEMIRGSGQFGDQQPVPDDADEQEQLMAFLGRDPRWSPPA